MRFITGAIFFVLATACAYVGMIMTHPNESASEYFFPALFCAAIATNVVYQLLSKHRRRTFKRAVNVAPMNFGTLTSTPFAIGDASADLSSHFESVSAGGGAHFDPSEDSSPYTQTLIEPTNAFVLMDGSIDPSSTPFGATQI